MATFISHSPADTEALGETWGRRAEPGLLIGLCGDLGTGKTQLVKGLARGLGSPERVHSPTFALLNIYSGGRLTLYHLDLYRLETREQIARAGLDEYLESRAVTVVEWADRWFDIRMPRSAGLGSTRGADLEPVAAAGRPWTPCPLRWVVFETSDETERRITYEDLGA